MRAVPIIVFSAILLIPLHLSFSQKPSANPTSKTAHPSEQQLRAELRFNSHDKKAHEQLRSLLQSKAAFRSLVIEDRDWVRNNPQSSFLALTELYATCTTALNDPEFAISQIRWYLDNVARDYDPDTYDDWEDRLAGLLESRGKIREAIAVYEDVVRKNPSESGFFVDLGSAQLHLGKADDAQKTLKRAVELGPSNEGTHKWLAEAYERSGKLRQAETEYRAWLSIYKAQYKSGSPTDSGHDLLNSLVTVEAKNHTERSLAEMQLKLAKVLMLEGRYDDALVQTQDALKADRTAYVGYFIRAQIHDGQERPDLAAKDREDARVAIERESSKAGSTAKESLHIDPRILFLEDISLTGETSYPAGPGEIVRILEPRMQNLTSLERIALARAYFEMGRSSDAKKLWERAIDLDPNVATAQSESKLGQALLRAGARADAVPHLRRAYELDPQNNTYSTDYESVQTSK